MAPEEFTMDESNMDISQSLRIEDLTMMFGHHAICGEENHRHSSRKPFRHFPQADIMSESECWSEPDRNVSLARVGLCDTGVSPRESVSDSKYRSRRSRISFGSRSEDNKAEEITDIIRRCDELEEEKNELINKLEFAMTQVNDLMLEKDELKKALAEEKLNCSEANKGIEVMKNTVLALESKIKDIEQQLTEAVKTTEKLRNERLELESTYMETERSLRRAADEATVQASQAALERARAQHDRLRIERELEETRDKLSITLEAKAQLEIEMTRKMAIEAENKFAVVNEGPLSEEDRPTSPDQGIDSDRLSSLEQNDAVALSPRKYRIF